MSKRFTAVLAAAGALLTLTGCNSVIDAIATDAAVEKVAAYIENAIDNRDELSPETKALLKAEVARIRQDALDKLAEGSNDTK